MPQAAAVKKVPEVVLQNASRILLTILAVCLAVSKTVAWAEVIPLPDGVAYLNWTDNNEPDFLDYIVLRSEAGIRDWGVVATVRESAYADILPPWYGEYVWKLQARDDVGNISPDSETSVVGVNCSVAPEPVATINTVVN